MTSQRAILAPMLQTGSESTGDRTVPNISMPNVSMVFHLNSITPGEYAFTFRFIIDSMTGTVTMETPAQPTSPVTPVAPTPLDLLHTSPVSNNKQGQEPHQSNKYEHDGTNSSIQVKLEMKTESLPPQQLLEFSPMQSDPDYEQYWEEQRRMRDNQAEHDDNSAQPSKFLLDQLSVHSSPQAQQLVELSPTQSDPDYEQYWEEQCRMRDDQNKHDDHTTRPFDFSLDSPLQHAQQRNDVEVQPMGAHSTAISVLNDSDEEIIPDSQEDVYLPYPESPIYLGKRSRTTQVSDTPSRRGKRTRLLS